jgi:hypothetical protein
MGGRGVCRLEWDAAHFCTLLGSRTVLFLGGHVAERAFQALHNAVAWDARDLYGGVGCQDQLRFGEIDNVGDWIGWVHVLEPSVVIVDGTIGMPKSASLADAEDHTQRTISRMHKELQVLPIDIAWLTIPPPVSPIEPGFSASDRARLVNVATDQWKAVAPARGVLILDVTNPLQHETVQLNESNRRWFEGVLPNLLLRALTIKGDLAASHPSISELEMTPIASREAHAIQASCAQRRGSHKDHRYLAVDAQFGLSNQFICLANAAWCVHVLALVVMPVDLCPLSANARFYLFCALGIHIHHTIGA